MELAAAAVLTTTPVRGPHPQAPPDAPLVAGDHRSVELVNLGGPAEQALLTRIAAGIGPAVNAVEAFWGNDWSHRIKIVATGSDRQFAANAGGTVAGQWSDVAAVAVADRVDPGRRVAIGQRIVLAPGATALSPAALRIVLTHELFHYATRADTAFDAPRWLTEGVADFVARPAPAERRAAFPLVPPTDADLDAPGPRRAQAYDRAWCLTRFVAENYGATKLRELYLAACAPGHPDSATATRRALGAGSRGFSAGRTRPASSPR